MRALLGLDLPQLDTSAVDRPPQAPAVASMEKTIAFHSKSQLAMLSLENIIHNLLIWHLRCACNSWLPPLG